MGSNVEIVRLDTTHGRPHPDRLFLPTDSDAEPKVWFDESVSYRWMKRFPLANWRDVVDQCEAHRLARAP